MTNADLRKISIAVMVAVAVTWCAATSDYSPIKPKPDRPVLRFLAKVAKLGLWVMWAAEPQPQPTENLVYHAQAYDKDGNRVLDHGKGW
jgi:hypothetical protein